VMETVGERMEREGERRRERRGYGVFRCDGNSGREDGERRRDTAIWSV
jgi:hypothetical protein